MANPAIDSVSPAGPLNLVPGQIVVFTVVAHDDDSRTGTITFNVTDANGANATPVTVDLSVADALTFSASTTAGTITQDPVVSSRFTLTV